MAVFFFESMIFNPIFRNQGALFALGKDFYRVKVFWLLMKA